MINDTEKRAIDVSFCPMHSSNKKVAVDVVPFALKFANAIVVLFSKIDKSLLTEEYRNRIWLALAEEGVNETSQHIAFAEFIKEVKIRTFTDKLHAIATEIGLDKITDKLEEIKSAIIDFYSRILAMEASNKKAIFEMGINDIIEDLLLSDANSNSSNNSTCTLRQSTKIS